MGIYSEKAEQFNKVLAAYNEKYQVEFEMSGLHGADGKVSFVSTGIPVKGNKKLIMALKDDGYKVIQYILLPYKDPGLFRPRMKECYLSEDYFFARFFYFEYPLNFDSKQEILEFVDEELDHPTEAKS